MIDPRFMTIESWSAITAPLLIPFGGSGRPTDERHWREWADAICGLPALKGPLVPDQSGFKDWRAWAYRLNEAILTLGL